MKKLRALLTKINDAIRPPHVGPLPPTPSELGGMTMNTKSAAEHAAADTIQSVQNMGVSQ
jgi:hypothetical protein